MHAFLITSITWLCSWSLCWAPPQLTTWLCSWSLCWAPPQLTTWTLSSSCRDFFCVLVSPVYWYNDMASFTLENIQVPHTLWLFLCMSASEHQEQWPSGLSNYKIACPPPTTVTWTDTTCSMLGMQHVNTEIGLMIANQVKLSLIGWMTYITFKFSLT